MPSLADLHAEAAVRGVPRYRTYAKVELAALLAGPAAPTAPPPVRLEPDGPLATIVLDDAETRNAIGLAALDALERVLDGLEADDGVRLVAVVGAGSAFSSGALLRDFEGGEGGAALSRRGSAVADRLAALPVPVVALLNGPAVGAGAELALAADWRVWAPEAELRFPHVGFGLVPGLGGLTRLQSLVGGPQALWLLARRTSLDVAAATPLGLVQDMAPSAELRSWARRLADDLGRSDRAALAAVKRVVVARPGERRRLEREAFLAAWPTHTAPIR